MNGSILETIIPREKSKHGGGQATNSNQHLTYPPILLPEGICIKWGGLLEAGTVLGGGHVNGGKD